MLCIRVRVELKTNLSEKQETDHYYNDGNNEAYNSAHQNILTIIKLFICNKKWMMPPWVVIFFVLFFHCQVLTKNYDCKYIGKKQIGTIPQLMWQGRRIIKKQELTMKRLTFLPKRYGKPATIFCGDHRSPCRAL